MLLYPRADYAGSQEKRTAAILRDCFFSCAMRRAARAMDGHTPSHGRAWLYHFEYRMHWAESAVLGDYHSSELDFVWGNHFPDIPLVHELNTKDRAMIRAFEFYWGNMAAFGNPNGARDTGADSEHSAGDDQPRPHSANAFPVWWAQNKSADLSLVMDVPPAPQSSLYAGKCDFWDAHMNVTRAEKRYE